MQLYKRGYLAPWLRCISHEEGQVLLKESHSGKVGKHEGAWALTGKILCLGIYWPNLYKDTERVTKKCSEYQAFTPF